MLDAPVQMQRETDALRNAAGKPSDSDFETILGVVAAAWPDGQAPLATLKFDNGSLSFGASGWAEAQIAQFRTQLASSGWELGLNNGVLTISRGKVS